MKRLRPWMVLAVVVLVPAALPPSAGAGAGAPSTAMARIIKTRQIAPGLQFTRIIQKKIPRRTFVLTMDPAEAVTLDVSLTQNQLPSSRPVSSIAKRADALAAVNGDFGSTIRPTHVFAQDGDLVQTAGPGALFALRADETGVFLGTPAIHVSITDRETGGTLVLSRLNHGPPSPGEIAGFSPLGGTLEAPPPFSCSVRLLPDGEPQLAEQGVVADYVVDELGCFKAPLERNGGLVLTADPATDEATQLLAMLPGRSMRLRWSLGWDGVFDVVGGIPILVKDGQMAVQACSSSFCRRNPRTAIGWTNDGRVLLVVIDGRQPRWSTGASLVETARVMMDLGAVQALNLDGGGSSTMVVENEVVNRPSDGHERRISNAVLVLPGPDPGEA
jgi:hypothetical protein